MTQIRFDPNTNDTDTVLVLVRDLIYRAEMIGPIDYTKLALLFIMTSLRTTHPSVHEALAPALMEGTLTIQALEQRLTYFHDLRATQSLEHMFSATTSSPPSSVQSSPTSPTIALLAYPPRANICPNCKCSGHSIEFCISPGGKMEGYSPSDAIARQRAVREGSRNRPTALPNTPTSSTASASPSVKIDPDGTVWINGIRYQPPAETEKASIAAVNIDAAMTAAD